MARLVYADADCDIAQLVERDSRLPLSPLSVRPCYHYKTSFWSSVRDETSPRSYLHFIDSGFLSHLEELCVVSRVALADMGRAMLASLSEDEKACFLGFSLEEYAGLMLQNAVMELVSNAAEHGNGFDPKKDIRVDLSLLVLGSGPRRFMVEVSDYGGHHDFRRHKEQQYVLTVDGAGKRGHGELIVNRAGWNVGLVMNLRGKEPYSSSVWYCLEF